MDRITSRIMSQQCPHRRPPTLADRVKSIWSSVPLSRATRCQYNVGHLGTHCDQRREEWATPEPVEQRLPRAYRRLMG